MAKISSYDLAGPLAGTESFVLVQNSSNVRLTADDFAAFVGSRSFSLSDDTTPQLGGHLDVNGFRIDSLNNLVFRVGDAAGVNKASFEDSAGVEIFFIDSNGNVTASGTINGRNIAADGTRLDTIATGAEVNAPLASQVEAEAGTENTKTMTPLRVSQAIAAISSGLQNKVDGTVPPSVTDDSNAGYSDGSFWIDVVANESYRCVDAAVGAAIWIRTTLQTTELATVALTGDSDDLTEGSINLLMTTAERTKLGNINIPAEFEFRC